MKHKDIEVLYFKSQEEFISWLNINYSDTKSYWVKIIKKGSKHKGINYVQAREVALMYGWIDSVPNKLDDDFYLLKFTHRRPKSIWSKINVAIVEDLVNRNKMHPEGLKEVNQAKADGRWDSAY